MRTNTFAKLLGSSFNTKICSYFPTRCFDTCHFLQNISVFPKGFWPATLGISKSQILRENSQHVDTSYATLANSLFSVAMTWARETSSSKMNKTGCHTNATQLLGNSWCDCKGITYSQTIPSRCKTPPPVVCTNLCTGEAASTALHTHTMLMNRLQHRQVTKKASIWSSQ